MGSVISLKEYAPKWNPQKRISARPIKPIAILRGFLEELCKNEPQLQAYWEGFDEETSVTGSITVDDVRALDIVLTYAKEHHQALLNFSQGEVLDGIHQWLREVKSSRRQRKALAKQEAFKALQAAE